MTHHFIVLHDIRGLVSDALVSYLCSSQIVHDGPAILCFSFLVFLIKYILFI